MNEKGSTIDMEFLTRVHVLLLDIKGSHSNLQTQVSRLALALESRESEIHTLIDKLDKWESVLGQSQAKVAFDHDDNLT